MASAGRAVLRRFARRLARDQRGVVGPAVAVLGVMLLSAAGMALDSGLYYFGNRELRSATEAAALAAAMYPDQAGARAQDYLVRNGYSDTTILQSVEVGRYCADSRLAAADRFDRSYARCPGNGLSTAVRIHTTKPSRRYFSRLLGPINPIPDLAATATAARIDEAGVGVTSDVLTNVVSPLLDSITTPLVSTLNSLLSSLLGTPIALGRTDVQRLMQGNVNAGLFFDKLAAKEGFAGTYGELASRSHGLKDIAEAAAEAAADADTRAALTVFAGQVGNGYKVPFSGLFGLGVWKNMPVGGAANPQALRAGMNAYQLLIYAVQAGPTAVDLSRAVSLLVPVSTVRIGLVSSGAGDRPRFAFGPAGETFVATSALRVQVLIDLPVNLAVASVNVHLPVILDVAAAQAQVTGINCPNTGEQASDTTVNVLASSGLVNAYVGDVPAFDPMARTLPALQAADFRQTEIAEISLLGIGATVSGRAVVQPVAGAQSAALTFGPGAGTPAQPAHAQTIGNAVKIGPTISSVTTSLLRSDGLDVKLGTPVGCLPLACSLLQSTGLSTVTGTVLPALVQPVTDLVGTVVDPLLTNVLTALGIQLGTARVWTTGARCGVPVLV
ncbi:TadG family pilus assembly protein [Novosphingobium clariflavum]|uniref:TadG family pilus assembly protein n=1 Tax=Novosphingobium clariflavum TaxID=2029884 RepID=A0ABV6SCA4_9SPHN|nr:TadG family pilus assembly protein [Novosphingobium clariflavum]